MIISTMKEMDTNTTDVLLTYFCRFLVPMVIVMVTVTLRSSSDATSRPFGSGIMMATTSPVPEGGRTRRVNAGWQRSYSKVRDLL